MKSIDASDALIVIGTAAVLAGAYLIAWPLVLIVVGAAVTGFGLWRS